MRIEKKLVIAGVFMGLLMGTITGCETLKNAFCSPTVQEVADAADFVANADALVGFNFGWDKPVPWFRFRFEAEEDLKILSEVYRNLAAMGVPLDMEHVAERFGIPWLGATGKGSGS